ncbi:2-oxo-4-hydroxy-4-carboxy-5-ureidoimidazoline decarboxylase [Streptomyces sp. B1866]|uniref:2-oxo-4-hydroxy-4-carboxy-5-ureidoimidazoline decarboxylase n=1 Tax=Streptomyces sp. B1866 TaxID=3075431 RepID=UPI00288E4628|nr:2-oxo-4-hydroxy-4-carboxy-5-ureidoimidazoline decarboxylase [Streptomyces sp. B1866]MDT3400175.1 2-oxo-4-hydroxy-4-carboxy-5-ureidoimidazoline decarboxylase [Streptomyces sp. B1866]
MTASATPGLARLNAADATGAAALLREVCASREWCAAVAAGRPYDGLPALLAAGGRATAGLSDDGLAEAVAGHPPIGRPGGGASAREQSGVQESERADLLALNLAYQERHGHVFLICATGRTGAEVRAALLARIGNDADTEREIVRAELGEINRIRLARLAADPGAEAAPDPYDPVEDPR